MTSPNNDSAQKPFQDLLQIGALNYLSENPEVVKKIVIVVREFERKKVLDALDELLFDIEQIHQEETNREDDELWNKVFYAIELRKAKLYEGEQ